MDENQRQITADDILKDINKRQKLKNTAKVDILDLEELKEYQRRKRTEYESVLKVKRLDIGQWMRYAQFEIEQHDIRRARSIFERALQINSSYVPLWIRYIDSEVKSKNINHARNILNRATTVLPRIEKFWFKYVMIEESLNNIPIVRSLFVRWCSLEPSINAWDAFVAFEIRHKEYENVRKIYSRYVMVHPTLDTWQKWIDFETKHGNTQTVRYVYSLALDTVSTFDATPEEDIVKLIRSFALWEANKHELERASALFKIASSRWPHCTELENSRVEFEKMFGHSTSVEESILAKRRRGYEKQLKENPRDYDTWWLYLDLIQQYFPLDLIDALEKSVSGNEPIEEIKSLQWKRYIYLWIRYLLHLELHEDDVDGTRNLYLKLINGVIPHKKFTFSKIWLMYSQFELRQENLNAARKILGQSLGICPKSKTYKKYIELEIELKEFDRVRKLYEHYLNFQPENVNIWISYAELEENLGDEERSRGIYEIALSDEVGLSNTDKFSLFNRYITFEVDAEEYAKARMLYQRFLLSSNYAAAVWINWAIFESSVPTESHLIQKKNRELESDEEEELEFEITDDNRKNSRGVFENALTYFKGNKDKESRKSVLKAYENYESIHGSAESLQRIKARLPEVVKRKKIEGNVEKEYLDYIFPDDKPVTNTSNSKILALAKKWKEDRTGINAN